MKIITVTVVEVVDGLQPPRTETNHLRLTPLVILSSRSVLGHYLDVRKAIGCVDIWIFSWKVEHTPQLLSRCLFHLLMLDIRARVNF